MISVLRNGDQNAVQMNTPANRPYYIIIKIIQKGKTMNQNEIDLLTQNFFANGGTIKQIKKPERPWANKTSLSDNTQVSTWHYFNLLNHPPQTAYRKKIKQPLNFDKS